MNEVSARGKCILIGEHSVVRGQPALVWPLASRRLKLHWETGPGTGIEINGGDYAEAFRKALKLALNKLAKPLPPAKWKFTIQSEIPVKAGLGSSAALSVATVRFLQTLGLQSGDAFLLALELENIFHGSSSGIDIAAVLEDQPILFTRGQKPEALELKWQPKLYLLDTGLRSGTKACVEQVSALARPDLDAKMGLLALKAKAALLDAAHGLEALAEAMNGACDIFEEWRLVPASVAEQLGALQSAGALAVKPTGSGNGGYILSLWKEEPPARLGLIPLSADS